jgi:hypothetical protein
MSHFSCQYEGDICILTERDKEHSQIAHIQSIISWIIKCGGGDIMPHYISFDDDKIKVERMIPLDPKDLFDEKMLIDYLDQAMAICKRLSVMKIHHNDLKPSNFVYKMVNGKRHYYVIDFGQSQIFNGDWKPLNPYLLDDEFRADLGYSDVFDPEFNINYLTTFGLMELHTFTDNFSLVKKLRILALNHIKAFGNR